MTLDPDGVRRAGLRLGRTALPAVLKMRTLAVALAIGSLVFASAFTLQAAVLGHPGEGALLAIKTIGTLERSIGSRARIVLNGRVHHTVCNQHFGGDGHVETVTVDGRMVLRKVGDRLNRRGALALAEFELAGCPRSLAGWLTEQLNEGKEVRWRRMSLGTSRVYQLRFRRATLGLVLYVARRSGRPLGLAIDGPAGRGVSTLSFRLRPSPDS